MLGITYSVKLEFASQAGEGVKFFDVKLSLDVEKRIKNLVRLDRLRKEYLAAGNRMGLLDLAEEYEHLGHYGCPATANELRKEAQEC